jgi:hypothetical protein
MKSALVHWVASEAVDRTSESPARQASRSPREQGNRRIVDLEDSGVVREKRPGSPHGIQIGRSLGRAYGIKAIRAVNQKHIGLVDTLPIQRSVVWGGE